MRLELLRWTSCSSIGSATWLGVSAFAPALDEDLGERLYGAPLARGEETRAVSRGHPPRPPWARGRPNSGTAAAQCRDARPPRPRLCAHRAGRDAVRPQRAAGARALRRGRLADAPVGDALGDRVRAARRRWLAVWAPHKLRIARADVPRMAWLAASPAWRSCTRATSWRSTGWRSASRWRSSSPAPVALLVWLRVVHGRRLAPTLWGSVWLSVDRVLPGRRGLRRGSARRARRRSPRSRRW